MVDVSFGPENRMLDPERQQLKGLIREQLESQLPKGATAKLDPNVAIESLADELRNGRETIPLDIDKKDGKGSQRFDLDTSKIKKEMGIVNVSFGIENRMLDREREELKGLIRGELEKVLPGGATAKLDPKVGIVGLAAELKAGRGTIPFDVDRGDGKGSLPFVLDAGGIKKEMGITDTPGAKQEPAISKGR